MDRDFEWLARQIVDIVNVLVLVIFALTLTYIIWQIIRAWIIGGGDQTKVQEGKKTILIGFIVLIVMVAIWGIVGLLRASFFGF